MLNKLFESRLVMSVHRFLCIFGLGFVQHKLLSRLRPDNEVVSLKMLIGGMPIVFSRQLTALPLHGALSELDAGAVKLVVNVQGEALHFNLQGGARQITDTVPGTGYQRLTAAFSIPEGGSVAIIGFDPPMRDVGPGHGGYLLTAKRGRRGSLYLERTPVYDKAASELGGCGSPGCAHA